MSFAPGNISAQRAIRSSIGLSLAVVVCFAANAARAQQPSAPPVANDSAQIAPSEVAKKPADQHADAGPDADGVCQELSSAFRFTAEPAFLLPGEVTP